MRKSLLLTAFIVGYCVFLTGLIIAVGLSTGCGPTPEITVGNMRMTGCAN